MKKHMIITSLLATLFLAAFSWLNTNEPLPEQQAPPISRAAVPFPWRPSCSLFPKEVELFYDVAPRFVATVTKDVLNKAKSIHDIFPADPKQTIVSYYSVSVSIVDAEGRELIKEIGSGPELTTAQLELLHSADYSTNIRIHSIFQEKYAETGSLADNYSMPHITVLPEKEAVCVGGKDAMIAYAKEHTKVFATLVKKEELRAGKITFTVNTEGKAVDAELSATSGYPKFDAKMIEVTNTLPFKWEPAKNAKGEPVEQRLTFFFGIIGC